MSTAFTPAAGRLQGKITVITGTGGGQGAAAALCFAREGATVIGCDIDGNKAAETAEKIRAEGGAAASAQADLTDEAAVSVWAADILEAYGRVDILYANAAATKFARLEDLSFTDWKWNFAHEVDVVFLPVKAFWPALSAAQGAAIVLVGSTAGVTGSVTNGRLAHTATKGAVVAMTQRKAKGWQATVSPATLLDLSAGV